MLASSCLLALIRGLPAWLLPSLLPSSLFSQVTKNVLSASERRGLGKVRRPWPSVALFKAIKKQGKEKEKEKERPGTELVSQQSAAV